MAVAGASGYAGGELLRLLQGHPDVELGVLAAGDSTGRPVTDLHPQLLSLAGRTFAATEVGALAAADVVMLALPHGQSGALAAALPADLPVIDLGADHRLADADAWGSYYGGAHAGVWPYGLPEVNRPALCGASRIAVPGCHATAVLLALWPLVSGGLVRPADLTALSVTGTSGAGRTGRPEFSAAQVLGDATAYRVGQHQHTAEILQALGAAASISLTPVLAPMPRGILATCTALPMPGVTDGDLRGALAYTGEPFVTLLAAGRWPHTASTVGSAGCHLQVAIDRGSGRVVVVSALDNLGKGAAAQAVQCLNLTLGLPEATGLSVDGIAP